MKQEALKSRPITKHPRKRYRSMCIDLSGVLLLCVCCASVAEVEGRNRPNAP